MRRALPIVLVALCASCAPASSAVEEREPRLEVGTGTWRFEALEDGQQVPLIRGAQGGWHVWVSARAEDLDAAAGRLVIEVQPADESRPADAASVGVQFDPPDENGMRSYLGWPAILADPSCAVGEMLRVHVTLTTSSGQELSAERYLVPGPGDFPPPPCME